MDTDISEEGGGEQPPSSDTPSLVVSGSLSLCNQWRATVSRILPVAYGCQNRQLLSNKSVTLREAHAGAVRHWEYWSPGKSPTLVEEVNGGLSPITEMVHCCRGGLWGVFPLRMKERQKQHGTDRSQHPFPAPCVAVGRRQRTASNDWAWEKGRGRDRVYLRSHYIYLCPTLIQLVNWW